ncbi:HK97 gp10 family phage protein [Acinetobacter colistiniresistens]|uniref:HK97 gp10 family phage protein n=1 Tax=Acinetobacter colistiniresistens TaxID=280145 RepID=N9PJ06_9GAMM|nr:HK97-gp10 family putative phage morphogenesis protein [Acinetobacter colistiniresistens]ENX33514.1 HK97 gp10 family phage protein [Acinetobacter colistiniresistens]
MAGVEVDITGLDDVVNRLQRLADPKRTKSIARKAARQAMNIVRDAARQNAKAIDDPESPEKIWKNISTQAGKSRNPNEIKMRVGVRGGASFSNPNPPSTSGGDTRHWRWVEFGRSDAPATPFMRPAFASNIQQVTNKFAEVFDAELDKELANL